MVKVAAQSMATTGALLLGRRTYEDFYDPPRPPYSRRSWTNSKR
jgi:dihydrofolate reductase